MKPTVLTRYNLCDTLATVTSQLGKDTNEFITREQSISFLLDRIHVADSSDRVNVSFTPLSQLSLFKIVPRKVAEVINNRANSRTDG